MVIYGEGGYKTAGVGKSTLTSTQRGEGKRFGHAEGGTQEVFG